MAARDNYLLVWHNTSVNCRYYVYTPFGGQHACCGDVCCFDGECLYNCWHMITELNVNYLAYFTLHWTCVVILHKGIFQSVEIQFHHHLLPCTHFYSGLHLANTCITNSHLLNLSSPLCHWRKWPGILLYSYIVIDHNTLTYTLGGVPVCLCNSQFAGVNTF